VVESHSLKGKMMNYTSLSELNRTRYRLTYRNHHGDWITLHWEKLDEIDQFLTWLKRTGTGELAQVFREGRRVR
jgi:hypothetical protein